MQYQYILNFVMDFKNDTKLFARIYSLNISLILHLFLEIISFTLRVVNFYLFNYFVFYYDNLFSSVAIV